MSKKTTDMVTSIHSTNGFDPLLYATKAPEDQTGKTIYTLDFIYKKLWFRLAYPQGRIGIKTLRLTEQTAIIQANIYLDKADAEPVSSFIAQCTKDTASNDFYLEEAQNKATDRALTDAGFGIQLIGIRAMPHASAEASATAAPKADPAVLASFLQTKPETEPVLQNASTEESYEELPVSPIDQESTETPEQHTQPVPREESYDTLPVSAAEQSISSDKEQFQSVNVQSTPFAVLAGDKDDAKTTALNTLPYTEDTPLEEILANMTYEEALTVVVDFGTCKNQTLQQVAKMRPASLKWYVCGYPGKNNLVRAGARIILDQAQRDQAG